MRKYSHPVLFGSGRRRRAHAANVIPKSFQTTGFFMRTLRGRQQNYSGPFQAQWAIYTDRAAMYRCCLNK